MWKGLQTLYYGTKQAMWSIMCCFYKLIIYFCKSEMFRVMLIKVVDTTLQKICSYMNNAMDNYQLTNNGKKLDESTGEWVKMSEDEN